MAIVSCDGCGTAHNKADYYRCTDCRRDWCRGCVTMDGVQRGDGLLGKVLGAAKSMTLPTLCGECPVCAGRLVQVY